jgi:preprotein translocase subunit SecA
MVSRAIEGAQRKVEGHNFDIRKHLIEYDDVMNQQRTAIYALRRQILKGEEIERKMLDMLSDVTSTALDLFVPEESKSDERNLAGLVTAVQRHFGLTLTEEQLKGKSLQEITQTVSEGVKRIYDRQKVEIGDFFEQLGRMLMLQTIDQRWKEHLERIDHLKEGIHLRAHAQKDPLIEYKKVAFVAFQEMNSWIYEETVEKLMKIKLVNQERAREVLSDRQELDVSELSYAGADENAAFTPQAGPVRQAPAPQMQPMGQRPLEFSYGPGDAGDGPQLNREQRRRQEKKAKKKKLKI